MTLKADVIESISKMLVNGNRLELPKDEQFANYAAVKTALTKAGGKYSKCGFAFPNSAQEMKDRLCGGEAVNDKKKFQFFATPQKLAKHIVELADIQADHAVLEPSAGQGAIACEVVKGDHEHLTLVELDDAHMKTLEEAFVANNNEVINSDFLQFEPEGYFERIVANPPFTKNQDIDHVMHMYELLLPGSGRLVSVMSRSWVSGSQKKQVAFREFLEEVGAEIIDVDAGEFKESGTNIATVIVVINK